VLVGVEYAIYLINRCSWWENNQEVESEGIKRGLQPGTDFHSRQHSEVLARGGEARQGDCMRTYHVIGDRHEVEVVLQRSEIFPLTSISRQSVPVIQGFITNPAAEIVTAGAVNMEGNPVESAGCLAQVKKQLIFLFRCCHDYASGWRR